MVIRTPDYHLRVFVSSTLKELAEERKAVRQAILKLRMAPVMFETAARPHPAQELYQSYLSQSHIFIGIYWQSYGWVAPHMTLSGLEDEYNLSCNIPRLIYIKGPAPEREPALSSLLQRIRNDNTSSYTHFSTPSELKELVQNDLALLLTEHFESVHSKQQTLSPTVKVLTNVPIPRNPLVGREKEFSMICDLLNQDDVALITLTGPGGTGKSRLAIQIGLEMVERFKDGVFMARLESINDVELVIPAIAEIFNIRENPDSRPIHEMLKEYLRDKHMLLLLDNFEHIVNAAQDVAELLEACPRLKCIVTSRTPLRLRAEKELPVFPLTIPPLQTSEKHDALSRYPSVELFIQRARAVRPDFSFSASNATAVAEICHRLDGLPLAIELAAARMKLFTPRALLDRLDHRFDLLTSGTRDLPERQRTLRKAIDWSYNLLNENEKKLFLRLSVFTGGFSLEAAESICDVDGDMAPYLDDALAALIDNNLVIQYQEYECGPRFGMLSTIHEYASELLTAQDEMDKIHLQHARYFLEFVTNVEPRVRSSERVYWQKVMHADFGNIRGSMEWVYHSRKDVEIGQLMVIRIGMFWQICGYIAEGLQWCNKMLACCDYSTPVSIHAGLLSIKGLLAWANGDHKLACEIIDLCLEMSRNQDDLGTLSRALMFRGMLAYSSRELDIASKAFLEALDIFRKTNDQWSQVLSLSFLGDITLYQDDIERANALHDESISLARQQGDPWCLMPALMSSAQVAIVNGDLDAAYPMLVEIIDVLNITGDHWSRSWTLIDLGHVTFLQGNLDHAGAHFLEALSIASSFGNQRALIVALAEAAALIAARAQGDPTELALAATLCGVIEPSLSTPGIFLWFNTQKLFEDSISHARSIVPPDVWIRSYAEGQGTSLERAIELVSQTLSRKFNLALTL